MRRSDRDDIVSWMREHAWNPSPIPVPEVEERRRIALEMRERLQRLYGEVGRHRLNRFVARSGRAAGLAGLGVLLIDLLSTGGAGTLAWLGWTATAAGGGKDIYDIYETRLRVIEKEWLLERRNDVDRYLQRLDQASPRSS